jgi:hypothetical protein
MLTADSNKKFVLCITDAFTKYAVVTSIQNKNAETVAYAILKVFTVTLHAIINGVA